MGIPRGSARLLIEEAKQRPFSGTVLQLGRSSVYFGERQLRSWAAAQGLELRGGVASRPSHDPRLAAQGCTSDETLFELLGFERVESGDISEWEGADHIFDLNRPVPEALHGRFDAIFETGTIVQIFDLPRVLANLHAMLRVGGRVIHCAVPSNNHMDLGFYMLCPTFFADFYAANGWRIECHYLCEYYAYWQGARLHSDRWRIYDYTPGCLDALSYGRYGGAQAATFLVATKLESSTGDVTPQLGQYRAAWQDYQDPGASVESAGQQARSVRRDGARARLERWLQRPGLAPVARPLKRIAEAVRRRILPRPMPPLRHRF
ncbi:MAG: hypothetical protein DWQ36_12435 [Acidobacteria bacterium]|nr:MAG: hypothetical protein DWQ30_24830 [Acidobacteriota bacterium]REK07345.1 MAG: hypothetical protein DWQ36_12435 [Acidobacteriota bacterium]